MCREKNATVLGGGAAGLSAALAFQDRGYKVTVIERDSPPDPVAGPGSWTRRGVSHANQPPFFLSELRNEVLRRYPDLAHELERAGVRAIKVDDCLHPTLSPQLRIPQPTDDELVFFAARRRVLDFAFHNFVSRQPDITIKYGTKVRRLLLDREVTPVSVLGVEIQSADQTTILETNIVVDTLGRSSNLLAPAIEAGAPVRDEQHVSKSAYYTRHYQRRAGEGEPRMIGLPSAMFDDIVALTFLADDSNYVTSLVVNQADPLLFDSSLQSPEVFEEIVSRFPKVARWSAIGEATTPVLGWSNMDFFWRSLIDEGKPAILGYFPAGDAVIRGNPKYGRGCTWAMITGQMVAEAVDTNTDRTAQALEYDRLLRLRFRKDWEVMLSVDVKDQNRFEASIGMQKATFVSRLLSKFSHWAMNIAVSTSPAFYREVVRGFYGITSPLAWTYKPINWWRILLANMQKNETLALAEVYSARPTRDEMSEIIQKTDSSATSQKSQ